MRPPAPLRRPLAAQLALVLTALLLAPAPGAGQSASLFSQTAARAPLVALQGGGPGPAPARSASLFAGAGAEPLFGPRRALAVPEAGGLAAGSAIAKLRHLIAEAEAGAAGYDAVNHGARVKPPHPPTQMTLGAIYDWIAATPGQPHAIGRYQFIPATLRRLARAQGLPRSARFTPALQDRLADQLLAEAGLARFKAGEISRRSFMYRLAKIWAGLPLPSGASYYQGVAGNRATMSWARFDAGMAQIFPG